MSFEVLEVVSPSDLVPADSLYQRLIQYCKDQDSEFYFGHSIWAVEKWLKKNLGLEMECEFERGADQPGPDTTHCGYNKSCVIIKKRIRFQTEEDYFLCMLKL